MGTAEQVKKKRKKRKKKSPFIRFLIFLSIVLAVHGFLMSGIFDIKKIEVRGNHYYKDREVVNIADANTGQNIFWHAGKKAIKKRLLGDPYFTDVKVTRKIPDTLLIRVKERRQMAAFVYGNEYIVIDKEGMVLRKTGVKPRITLVKGMKITSMKVGEKIGVQEKNFLRNTIEMLNAMEEGDFYFKKVVVSKVMVKGYITDNLSVQGSPAKVKRALDNGNLQKVVAKLFNSGIKRGMLSIGEDSYMSFNPIK